MYVYHSKKMFFWRVEQFNTETVPVSICLISPADPCGDPNKFIPQRNGKIMFIFVIPLVQAFWYSLNTYDILTGSSRFVGLRYYERLLGDFEQFRRMNRLLEIGCGAGLFLSAAREAMRLADGKLSIPCRFIHKDL